MMYDAVTIVAGLGSDVVVGVGLDHGLEEALIGSGADGLAEDHLLLVPA